MSILSCQSFGLEKKYAILEEGSVMVAFIESNHKLGAFSSKSLDASNEMLS